MKLLYTSAIALLFAGTASATPHKVINNQGGAGGNATANPTLKNSNNTDIYYPQQVPNIVGPVPRDSVPVFSIYGQLDHQQKGVYGAQLSIPLQFK